MCKVGPASQHRVAMCSCTTFNPAPPCNLNSAESFEPRMHDALGATNQPTSGRSSLVLCRSLSWDAAAWEGMRSWGMR